VGRLTFSTERRVRKIYIASKAKHAARWRALRDAGVDIRASWIDSPINRDGAEPTATEWRRHWQMCLRQAAAADAVLFYAEEGETQCGALIEVGAALAAGKRVYVVSPYEWTIANHPLCTRFDTLQDAIEAIRRRRSPGSSLRGSNEPADQRIPAP
jgi:hypothetical protein